MVDGGRGVGGIWKLDGENPWVKQACLIWCKLATWDYPVSIKRRRAKNKAPIFNERGKPVVCLHRLEQRGCTLWGCVSCSSAS